MKDAKGEVISGKRVSPLRLAIRIASFKTLVKAFPSVVGATATANGTTSNGAEVPFVPPATAKATQEEFSKELAKLIADNLDELQIWNIRQAVCQSLEIYLAKLDLTSTNDGMKVMDKATALLLAKQLLRTLADYKYSAIRENGLRCLMQLFDKITGTPVLDEEWKKLVVGELETLLAREGLQSIKAKEIDLRKEVEGAMVV
jgi:DNA-binding protein Fis